MDKNEILRVKQGTVASNDKYSLKIQISSRALNGTYQETAFFLNNASKNNSLQNSILSCIKFF